MKLNKKLVKTMVFALGFGAISLFGVNSTKAAGPTKPDMTHVTLNPATESLSIAEQIKDNAKFWGIVKETQDEKKANLSTGGKHYIVFDINPLEAQTIDLTSFGKSKKIILAVGATENVTSTLWDIKEIEPASKDFVVEYMSNTDANGKKVKNITYTQDSNNTLGGSTEVGYLVATITKEGTPLPLAANSEKIEVQEGDGAWITFKDHFKEGSNVTADSVAKKLKSYTSTGKTLKFRLKDSSKWNTNVSTVKISVLPKAPSIKFDTTKGTTNLKSTMQVKVEYTGQTSGQASYIDAKDKMNFKDLGVYTGTTGLQHKGGTIAVRTKATAKSLASKETVYTISKQEAPTVTDTEGSYKNDNLISSELKASLKVLYDVKKGAVLRNEGDKDYEYFISYAGSEPNETSKWNKLSKQKVKGKKKTPTVVSLKYSATEKNDSYGGEETKIFLRLAGMKQDGNSVTLASPIVGKKFKLQKIEQAFTASGDGTTGEITTITVKKATAKTHKIDFTLTNLQKKKTSPKIKITTKVNGVSLKADKFVTAASNDKSTVTVKISKSTFKNAGTYNLAFTIEAEGTIKTHNVKFIVED